MSELPLWEGRLLCFLGFVLEFHLELVWELSIVFLLLCLFVFPPSFLAGCAWRSCEKDSKAFGGRGTACWQDQAKGYSSGRRAC